jgi:hypothetical protein
MKEIKPNYPLDLSEYAFEQAIFDMDLEFPVKIKLFVNKYNMFLGGKIAAFASMINGLDCEVFVSEKIADDEWALYSENKHFHTMGAMGDF